MNKISHSQTELLALADAYVCGALEMDEQESFEARLLEDQSAREAVAAAVELATVTRAALQANDEHRNPVPASNALQRSDSLEWAVTIACAGLVIIGLAVGASRSGEGLVQQTDRVESHEGELALIWGEMIASDSADLESESSAMDDLLQTFDERDLQITDSPEWMVAAVGKLSARDDMDHERDMENRQ